MVKENRSQVLAYWTYFSVFEKKKKEYFFFALILSARTLSIGSLLSD